MPERQRQRVLGAHAIVIVAQIGVADPATGDFDKDFIGARLANFEFHRHHRLARARHHPTNWLGAHGLILQLARQAHRRTGTRPYSMFILPPKTIGLALIKVKEKQKFVF
jgi:hypothetical protein